MDEPHEIENWKRISVLGSGAFGVVSLWQNQITDEYIAIKKCKFKTPNQISNRQRERWENEVHIMKSLDCLNIVQFKQLPKHLEAVLLKYNPSKLPLLSMEYCTKGNLRHVLNQAKNSSGLQEGEVRAVLADIARAVAYLHKFKITHRDIKPENIVLQECDFRDGGLVYKLIDLGYAKELTDAAVSFVGTLNYLAPEIIKTENYNYSVDYWSLGTVAFEIICGVLPFLPQYTPFERFQYIEKKKPEHICIYQLHSGSVAHSSELLKENHISDCLKQNIEIWLRHVLQYDPNLRMQSFPDNTNVFDFLFKMLDKRIISVFSVHTLEFYSYEIDDTTLIGTLKDWISRDTKVLKNEQVLLTNFDNFDITDDKFVEDVLAYVRICILGLERLAMERNFVQKFPQLLAAVHEIFLGDYNVYVFKKGAFINRETFTLPKYVRVLFENCSKQYRWRELRMLYAKSLFFLTQEEKMISALLSAFKLFTGYIYYLNMQLKNSMQQIYKDVTSIIQKTDCYYNLHRGNSAQTIDMEKGDEYRECLLNFKQLIGELEKCIQNTNKLMKKVDVLTKRQILLDGILPKVNPIINSCEIGEAARATELLNRGVNNAQGQDICSSLEMAKIVSKAIKEKDKLLNNKNFQSYSKATSVAIKDVEILLNWMNEFQVYIKKLSQNIDENQRQQYRILLSSVKPKNKVSLANGYTNHFVHFDTDFVINENQELRYQFEQALNQMFLDLKKFCDEI